jgi:hypothetical protein
MSTFRQQPDDAGGERPRRRPGYGETEERYQLYRGEPVPADDYPERADIVTAITRVPDLFEATCSGEPFDSDDFARRGEVFCYLKIDGRDSSAMRFADRDAVEDAMEEALRRSDTGWLLGGATGLRYSYVDFAVTDVDRAVEALRGTLRAGRIPTRTWILFFDAEREDEWIGIWDETPPPPSWDETD